jgi:hypothetical protein
MNNLKKLHGDSPVLNLRLRLKVSDAALSEQSFQDE